MSESKNRGVRWMLSLLPVATFLIGVLLGGLIIGVGFDSDSDGADEAGSSASEEPSDVEPSAPDTTVTVPAACRKAAEQVDKAVGLLRDGAAAVRDFQPEKLTEILNELEDVDRRLRELSPQCTGVPTSDTP